MICLADMESLGIQTFRVKRSKSLIFYQTNCLSICCNRRTQLVYWFRKKTQTSLKLMLINKANILFVSIHWMDRQTSTVWCRSVASLPFTGKILLFSNEYGRYRIWFWNLLFWAEKFPKANQTNLMPFNPATKLLQLVMPYMALLPCSLSVWVSVWAMV